MADEPTGLWLIGARGSVTTTAARGLPAKRAEPPARGGVPPHHLPECVRTGLRAMADPDRTVLPAARAALTAAHPIVGFAPSTGIALPASDELARREGPPCAGRTEAGVRGALPNPAPARPGAAIVPVLPVDRELSRQVSRT